jgi:hypothetical protein
VGEQYERMDLAFDRTDWVATEAAEALLRCNRPLLAYLAGKPDAFTSKDHLFTPGETVEKQLIVINNSRETVKAECTWSLALPRTVKGQKRVSVATGQQERIPLRFALPATLSPGEYTLNTQVRFSNGETQTDAFNLRMLAAPQPAPVATKVALFDPHGETGALMERQGVRCQPVNADTDLSGYDILVVGKAALTTNGAAPDITRVRDGLKVLLFEQTPDVLEKRFGFRVAEYGLRRVFTRVPDHPALAGLAAEDLRDWRGAATIQPPRAKLEANPKFNGAPTTTWCGISVPRLWRCGNRGNVASVLIEKPACGDFLPIIDGGYNLQYGPLLEYREGRGVVLFCQMDVTGRTETDPAAETLTRNILRHVSEWKPLPAKRAAYVGDVAGRRHLEAAGVSLKAFQAEELAADEVLLAGPGSGRELAASKAALAKWLEQGERLLALGFDQKDADAILPFPVQIAKQEHISTFFEAQAVKSPFTGIGPADLLNRDPRELPLIRAGTTVIGNGVLANTTNVVFCQIVPWQFDAARQSNLKRTFRRTSVALARLLANHGVRGSTPILERFHAPVPATNSEPRWLSGLYLDQPVEWDDPYRFFRW